VNIKQYHREVKRTTSESVTLSEALCVGGLGLTGEAGEVADHLKKHLFHGHTLDRDALCKEMGDVLWYLVFLCNALNISLAEVMDRNATKLRARYPDGWSQERSINRTEEVRA
jgi:NTP pyrophosphatase (non-canonical NTP hydrolase)